MLMTTGNDLPNLSLSSARRPAQRTTAQQCLVPTVPYIDCTKYVDLISLACSSPPAFSGLVRFGNPWLHLPTTDLAPPPHAPRRSRVVVICYWQFCRGRSRSLVSHLSPLPSSLYLEHYFMEAETSGGLAGKQDDDVEVDHYFLPGGILDTHQEEDMIGGSLLDEIGGVGNVTAVSCQSFCFAASVLEGYCCGLSLGRPLSISCWVDLPLTGSY